MHTLVSISTLRDNTYQLLRHVWNDIQEDWPFYTEQERQQMKRSVEDGVVNFIVDFIFMSATL